MLKELRSLVHEDYIAGVRVKTTDGDFFDISIEVYSKKLGLSTEGLKSIQLVEYGDSLMTEDEFDGGYIVNDASNDHEILSKILYFLQSDEGQVFLKKHRDPKQAHVRKKKINDLKQSYYSYLPNDMLPAFAEYHLDFFSGDVNLYNGLTSAQESAIKDYFKWRSRLIFFENGDDRHLQVREQKMNALLHLMGKYDDWVYDGTIDTGEMGGGKCELGHSLRYEHYAASNTAKKTIIFGSTCVKDFFDISDSTLRKIMQAQDTIMKEFRVIVYLMRKGLKKEYVKEYSDYKEVLGHSDIDYNVLAKNGAEWVKKIATFMQAGLPITRTMLMKYKDIKRALVGKEWLLNTLRKEKEIADYYKDEPISIDMLKMLLSSTSLRELEYHLASYAVSDKYKDPFFKQGMIALPHIQRASKELTKEMFRLDKMLDATKKRYYFVKTADGRKRVSRELAGKEGVYADFIISEEKIKWLHLVKKYGVGKTSLILREYDEVNFQRSKSYAESFMLNYKELARAVKWILSMEFKKDSELLLNPPLDGEAPLDYSKYEREKPEVIMDADVSKVIHTLEQAREDDRLSSKDFVFKILATVKKTGRITIKQQKYIDDALAKIK